MDFLAMDATVRAVLFGGLFLVSLAATLWTVYDAQVRSDGTSGWVALWWIAAGVGAILVLPALVINAFNLDVEQQDLVNPFSYLGIGGVALSVVSAAGYALATYIYAQEDDSTVPVPTPPPVEPTVSMSDDEVPSGQETVLLRRPPKKFAYLIVQSGLRAGAPLQLGDITNIGRTGENEMVLDDDGISRQHARVRFDSEHETFVFYDLASSNGSWLVTADGKQRIESPHPLSDGDVVELGSIRLVFKELGEAVKG